MSLTADALKKLQQDAALENQETPATKEPSNLHGPIQTPDANQMAPSNTELESVDIQDNSGQATLNDEARSREQLLDAPSISIDAVESGSPEIELEMDSLQIEVDNKVIDPSDTQLVEAWQELAALADVKSIESELRASVSWREMDPPNSDPVEPLPETPVDADDVELQSRPRERDDLETWERPLDGDKSGEKPFVYLDQPEISPGPDWRPTEDHVESTEELQSDEGWAADEIYDPVIPSVDDLMMDGTLDESDASVDDHSHPISDTEAHTPGLAEDDTSVAPLAELVDTVQIGQPPREPSVDASSVEADPLDLADEQCWDTGVDVRENISHETATGSRDSAESLADDVSADDVSAEDDVADDDTVSLSELGDIPSSSAAWLDSSAGDTSPPSPASTLPGSELTPTQTDMTAQTWDQQVLSLRSTAGTRDSLLQLLSKLESVCGDRLPKVLLLSALAPTSRVKDVVGLMAAELGERDMSVLLVDANLQDQSLTRAMGMLGSPGFCDAVTETCGDNTVVQATKLPGVNVVPCGDDVKGISRDPAQLSESQLIQTLRSWQEQYDHVLIEGGDLTASLLAPLARTCQATVLVIPHGQATLDAIKAASEGFRQADAKVVGCVLTGFPDDELHDQQ